MSEDKYIYQKRYYYKHKEEIYKRLKDKLENDKEFREKRNIKGRDLRRKKSKELINLRSLLTELEEWLKEETKLCDDYLIGECHTDYTDVLDKIQKLKEKYK